MQIIRSHIDADDELGWLDRPDDVHECRLRRAVRVDCRQWVDGGRRRARARQGARARPPRYSSSATRACRRGDGCALRDNQVNVLAGGSETDAAIVVQLETTLSKVWLVSANKLAAVLRAATSVDCESMGVDEFTRLTNAVSV